VAVRRDDRGKPDKAGRGEMRVVWHGLPPFVAIRGGLGAPDAALAEFGLHKTEFGFQITV